MNVSNKGPWTEREDKILRDEWPDLTISQNGIGELVGRSGEAVGDRAKRLGLPRRSTYIPPDSGHEPDWQPVLRRLEELAKARLSSAVIAVKLNSEFNVDTFGQANVARKRKWLSEQRRLENGSAQRQGSTDYPWDRVPIPVFRELCDDTDTSYTAIAAELNRRFGTAFNKNAVISKVRRLGFPKRPPAVKRQEPSAQSPSPQRASSPRWPTIHSLPPLQSEVTSNTATPQRSVQRSPKPKVIAAPRTAKIIPLPIYGRITSCCWPENDRRPWIFCDKPTKPGKPYCKAHDDLAYVKARDRRDDAA